MAMYTHMIRDKWAFGYCWVAPPATSWQRTGRNKNCVALASEDIRIFYKRRYSGGVVQGSGEGRAWCKLRLLTVLKSIKSFFFLSGVRFLKTSM